MPKRRRLSVPKRATIKAKAALKRLTPKSSASSPRAPQKRRAAAGPKRNPIKENYKEMYETYFITHITPLLQNMPTVKPELDQRIIDAGGENELYQAIVERSLPSFQLLNRRVIKSLGPERVLTLLSASLPMVFP